MTESLLAANDQSQQQQITSYKDHLVGEGKKFKDDEALARGKYEADVMVETLKRQMDELRSDYQKEREQNQARATLEDMLGQLNIRSNNTNTQTPTETNVQKPSIDPEQIESLFEKKIQEHEKASKERENFNLVQTKLKETLGDNYESILKERINELGLTDAYLTDLAKKAPNAVLKMFSAEQRTESFQAPPRPQARPEQFSPKGAEKRTWAYYQKMKATDPKRYYNPQTNIDIHNDMMALGDAFKDGDYYRFKEVY